MKRSGRFLFAVLFAFAVLPAAHPAAAAGPLYDWNKAGVQKFTDPAGDTKTYRGPYIPCFDIVAAYHAFDGTHHFFRIDLASPPDLADIPEDLRKDYSDARYGIFINSAFDGARENNYYVPYIPGIGRRENRIDIIIDARLANWSNRVRHWNGTDFTSGADVSFQRSGATLEWKWKGDIGADFTWYAAVMLPQNERNRKTFDLVESQVPAIRRPAEPVPAPIPAPTR